MEVRIAFGRALQSLPRPSHSSPLAQPLRARFAQCSRATTSHSSIPQFRQAFSSSTTRRQEKPSDASASEEARVAQHLDSALDLKANSAASSRLGKSHFASPQAQEERRSERSSLGLGKVHLPPRRGSMEDLLLDFSQFKSSQKSDRLRPSTRPGTNGELGLPERKGDRMAMGRLLDPDPVSDRLDPMRNTSMPRQPQLPLPLPVRLGPSLGRTVKVSQQKNIDVSRAFRQLEIMCRKNQVKQDFQRQRFHERPGLKRKRVRSERWRRTFKEGFKGMIALVKKMKQQGW